MPLAHSLPFVALVGIGALITGCDSTISFQPLPTITRIEVFGRDHTVDKHIDASEDISRIKAFVDSHASGWRRLSFTTEATYLVRADLYDGSTFIACFGIKPGSFDEGRDEHSFTKTASVPQQKRFLQSIGVRESVLDN